MRRPAGLHSARETGVAAWRICVGLLGVVIISAADLITDPNVSLSVLYPIPILWTLRAASVTWGVITAVLSVAAWLLVDLVTAETMPSWTVLAINVAVRLGSYLLIVYLEYRLQRESANARTDPLTGLLNRRGLEEEAKRLLRDLERGHAISVAFYDLDAFKHLNDRLGHHTGDDALRRVGRALQRRVRSTDVVARVGGDEFVVLLRLTGYEGAARAAEHIRVSMESALRPEWGVGVTGGLAFFETLPTSVNALLGFADSALYQGKRAGGHRMVTYRMGESTDGELEAEMQPAPAASAS